MRPARHLVEVDGRAVHAVEAGPTSGGVPAVVLLHQTPRSVDEYRDVVGLLAAAGRRAVAVDTPGFGASDPPEQPSVAGWAAAVLGVLDALGLDVVDVVGHHTGGVLGLQVAATAPDRVRALVLSSTPYADAAWRGAPPHGVDVVAPSEDGTHLAALWQGRRRFYPAGRPDLLERFVRDALAAGQELVEAGHHVVREFRVEKALPRVSARVGLLSATGDPYAQPHLPRWTEALPDAPVAEVLGGGVPLPDERPEQFTAAVLDLLERLGAGAGAR